MKIKKTKKKSKFILKKLKFNVKKYLKNKFEKKKESQPLKP